MNHGIPFRRPDVIVGRRGADAVNPAELGRSRRSFLRVAVPGQDGTKPT